MAEEKPPAEDEVEQTTPDGDNDDEKPVEDRKKPNYGGELVHPGHRLNVYVERVSGDSSAHGGKPWLATSERNHHRYPPVPFDTAEEANEWAADKVRRADQGMKEDDKSQWDERWD